LEQSINFFHVEIFGIEIDQFHDHFSVFFGIAFFAYLCHSFQIFGSFLGVSPLGVDLAELFEGLGIVGIEIEHLEIGLLGINIFACFLVTEAHHEVNLKYFRIFIAHHL